MRRWLREGVPGPGVALLGWACLLLAAAHGILADEVPVGQATIYAGSSVDRFIVTAGSTVYVAVPGARRWDLCEAGGPYVPMPLDEVVNALGGISYPLAALEATVVILPAPRCGVCESSAEGSVVFLSPGRCEWPREHVHYTVTHEMGHVLHNAMMPDKREDLWREYARLRGVDFDTARTSEKHSARLHEMFAEDFRVLFGDDLARCGSGVENHDLVAPDAVPGLREFFLALPSRASAQPSVHAQPNPFTACLAISGGSAASALPAIDEVIVYDASGRAIARLKPAGAASEVTWDGRAGDGSAAAPGVYFLAVRSGAATHMAKVVKVQG
jgi:FlgD Ig-like domain